MVLAGKKVFRLLCVLLAVSALTFLMVNLLPGDVAYVIGGEDSSPEDIQAIREAFGLDKNIVVRYLSWLGNILRGDFGESYLTREPVLSAIASRLPVTIELILISQLIALALALPAGIYSAYRNNSFIDRCISGCGFATLSIPSFVMALLLIFVFALQLKWLPATGYVPLSEGIWQNLQTFLLPSLSIALIEWVPLMRVLRTDMIVTLQEDFITVAKAKGMPTWRILFRDALKPSSLTLITILGLQIGHWIGAAVIIEIIYAMPGIGRLLINAVFSRDFLMVQGCVLIVTAGYVTINAMVDFLYIVLDPRIRREVHHG
jgi:peptide/nickel transport system permease protein